MSQQNNSIIESLGIYLPEKIVSSQEIMKGCKSSFNYPFERVTGIKNRHMAGETEFSIDLSKQAIIKCFETSRFKSYDIELLICCNISRYDGPNFQFSFEPSTSVRLRNFFEMNNALCFDISNACAGMFTAINVADAFLKTGIVRNAMIASGEYITHLTKTAQLEIVDECDERLSCLTLGDCGAAVILEQTDKTDIGFHDIDMYTLPKHSAYCIAKPTCSSAGGAIMLTDSDKFLEVAIPESIKHIIRVLHRNSWQKETLDYYIPHQTARAPIAKFVRYFNEFYNNDLFTNNNVVYNMEHRGNTSSTTHLLAIWDYILNGKIQNGDNILFSVQASGITLGVAPYTFDNLPERLNNRVKSIHKSNDIRLKAPKNTQYTKHEKLIRIESFGTISDVKIVQHNRSAVKLATAAAEECLKSSIYSKSDIDLLLHTGIYSDDFICEPAHATLIAHDLEVNSHPASNQDNSTFAFDILNGSIGFLNACYSAYAMIFSGKVRNAMVLASEIDNNMAEHGQSIVGFMETGSAAILDFSPTGVKTGFLSFSFQYFTDYIDKYYSYSVQEHGNTYFNYRKNPQLNEYYIDCISQAVDKYLKDEKISKNQIKAVFPPQISKEFINQLICVLDFSPECIVSVAYDNDYYTSSTLYSMQAALDRKVVKSGDIGLIINVGTGIQVACALYRF